MFIKSHGIGLLGEATGSVQSLVSWLPASLKALVLQRGLDNWDQGTLRMLFRGLRNNKQTRLPNLKVIKFANFADFDTVMPDDLKVACRETGVKLGYTSHRCKNLDCHQVLGQLEYWDGLPWITALGKCCQYSWLS